MNAPFLYRPVGISLLLGLLVAFSCGRKDGPVPLQDRGSLVNATQGGTLTKSQVTEFITDFPAQAIAQYDVTYHVLTYRTEYDGSGTESRGLLILPNGVAAPRLLAYFHGTLLPLPSLMKKETPTLFAGNADDFREVRTMGLAFASAGYAVFLPDYIGYGLTEKKEHPYINYPEMFKSNIDGLIAARQFMTQQGIPADRRLFLTGWSQGGGACLSAHKYIQEQYADRFTVVASSSLAAPSNFRRFLKTILEKRSESQGVLFITSWGLYALNRFSAVKRPTDQIWTYPVPNQMAAVLPLSDVPNQIFRGAFLKGILDETDRPFTDLIRANTISEGWRPVGKVFLHHGDADGVVPYFNSVDAEAGLRAQGGDVKLYTYPGGDHDTELDNFVLTTLNDFKALP
jgi:pimeloyl-ACP methyl ester carboxylesterase